MDLTIKHRTLYAYGAPVPYGVQRLRLTPQTRPGQNVQDWALEVRGGAVVLDYLDPFENRVHLVRMEEGAQEVAITAYGSVATEDRAGMVGPHIGHAPLWLFRQATPLTAPGEAIAGIAESVKAGGIEGLHELMKRIAERIEYRSGGTDFLTTAEEAAARGAGVCQDHAHAFAAAARLMGVPARYASGYLHMDENDRQAASHAWAEAYLPDLGWAGFDPSNGISPDERYVCLATGRDYHDAAPVNGLRFGSQTETLAVDLVVEQ